MNCSPRRLAGKLSRPEELEKQDAQNARRSALVSTSRPTSLDSGCGYAIWRRSVRTRVSSRISMTTFVRRSGRRPSSFSTACCARIASVLDLIKADYTFLNERLAKHYGISDVYGSPASAA